ncbi:MAG: PEP-CTERM sorting domain-containing protein [Pseudomonadota bacterium]|nr:PEP-CTERM sorting domain-containing protein [Pseudomonadota bacterium]
MNIVGAQDYAKLTYGPATSGYPGGLTLGGIVGIHADVVVNSATTAPYFQLGFVTGNTALGQSSGGNQILFIEFQSLTVTPSGDMDVNPMTTLFNMYDNTTGQYLQNGQQDVRTLDSWLSTYSFLSGTAVDQIRIAIGLGGGAGPGESLTVNALAVSQADAAAVPEPASWALVGLALGAAGFAGRKRAK